MHDVHVRTHALRVSVVNDSTYGLTSPPHVYSHDQVPIKFCDRNYKTMETKGEVAAYDVIGKDLDTK